jgi:hypothetical protein
LKYSIKKGKIRKLQIILEKEMNKAKYKAARSYANETDQYKTPKKLKKDIFDSLDLKEEEVFDICLYREDWRPKINYDALK